MEKNPKKPITFILSTGRTGTQFFSKYLTETCAHTLCLHEPKPSRRFKWYSNFYLTGKLSKKFIASQYFNKRKSILQHRDYNQYIESSNFLFGCVEPILTQTPDLAVLHIVRHPLTYVRSHLNKGYWSGIKGFTARNIPGWMEYIEPGIKKTKDPVLILLARWIYVNKIILSYQDNIKYMLVRFEDLFGGAAANPVEQLNAVRGFIGHQPLDEQTQQSWLKKSANKSRTNLAEKWPVEQKHLAYINENGADLLQLFDYKIDV